MRTDQPAEQRTIEVIVVASDGCHFCDDAEQVLEGMSAEFPIAVRAVDMLSAEGAELVRIHRPPMPPLVLVDGEFFSFGRLPRKKLRRLLEGPRS